MLTLGEAMKLAGYNTLFPASGIYFRPGPSNRKEGAGIETSRGIRIPISEVSIAITAS